MLLWTSTIDEFAMANLHTPSSKVYFFLLHYIHLPRSSPFLTQVLLLTSTIDEFAMANLHTYSGKELLSAEKASLNVSPPGISPSSSLSTADADALCAWLAETVPGIAKASPSARLTESPAIVVGHQSAAMRRMMGMMEAGRSPELPPQVYQALML